MREEAISNGSSSKTFDIVSVNANYLPFGYGRHACPGRVLRGLRTQTNACARCVKFESEGVRPPEHDDFLTDPYL